MVFEKKYWSQGEFTRKSGEPYNGYVGIYDGEGYIYDTEELLTKTDAVLSQINCSNYFFDRILKDELQLPHTKEEIQFGANDFLTSTTLRNIVLKLQENNDYIFRNTIISNTRLPAAEKCSILATKGNHNYLFLGKSGSKYSSVTDQNKQDIINGFIHKEVEELGQSTQYPLQVGETPKLDYGNYFVIPNVVDSPSMDVGKLSYYDFSRSYQALTMLDPTFYPQVDSTGKVTEPPYNFNNLVHNDIKIYKVEGGTAPDSRILHILLFLVFKKKVVIIRTRYYQNMDGTPPTIDMRSKNDVIEFSTLDPANNNTASFLGLHDMELHGNYMYLVDQDLNMILRYDISYLLYDESDIGFNVKSIRLINNVSGDGHADDRTYFMNPSSIAVDDDWIYVADAGNRCIKKYSSSFDYETTLRNGNFASHHIGSIAVNPYEFTLEDGTKVEAGSLWIFSINNTALYVSIVVGNKTIFSRPIEQVHLLKDEYTWDEDFKSAKFSFTHSNYYYLATTKRVFKIHVSRPTYPFATLSYFKQRNLISSMIWNTVFYPWHLLPAGEYGDEYNITWSYRPLNTSAEVLDNRGFALCGIDSFVPTKENQAIYEQFNGDLIFHIGNLCDMGKIDAYTRRYKCKFSDIPGEELKNMIKCSGLFLYIEPATFIESVSNPLAHSYITDDLKSIHKDEYVNSLTFNAHLYKMVYNLVSLKNNIIGRFQGAYNLDNLMVFDQLVVDNVLQQLKTIDNHNFFIYNNEATSIIVNRVFESIWEVQEKLVNHIKTKAVSTPAFTNNSFRTI